jgi:hypothetical protein
MSRTMPDENPESPHEIADPTWFRGPTPREHKLGAALFTAFGVWFVLLFFVVRDWSFCWVILAMAVVSLWRALWHWTGIGISPSPGTPGEGRGGGPSKLQPDSSDSKSR